MKLEEWLRTVCFQKPTSEAYDLARDAYNFAIEEAVKVVDDYGMPPFDKVIADKIKELKEV